MFDMNWTASESNWTVPEAPQTPPWYVTTKIQVTLYAIIFLLAVIGNALIILTLAQNRRMRTVTNLFLLNLAFSDLLLGVLCMPFTLTGYILRDFVLGEAMCKLIPFLQACLVAVSAWTLVAISVERYYAICHPLRSLSWQTLSHAYKTILSIWLCSFICMLPIAFLSELKPTIKGNRKCRENWPTLEYEKAFTLLLDIGLMVSPLVVLAVTYSLIIRTLWQGIQTDRASHSTGNSTVEIYVNLQMNSTSSWRIKNKTNITRQQSNWTTLRNWSDESNSPIGSNSSKSWVSGLRRTNAERSLRNKKKRVIKMLCVVVLEFFVCWAPLYTVNTIVLFTDQYVYDTIGYTGISLLQLLAYTSSCCNPITYCFMNVGFRKSFLKLFSCVKRSRYSANFRMEGSDCQVDLKYSNQRCSEN
uniref:Sulfakinin receptor n=1 Tax=Dendroctonus armandi TaxID=77159 RepID=A0A8F7GPY2_9CUCU|nr:sulfakinin receptor [Dendroctonus armandi]